MEFPDVGAHCEFESCRMLDFLPVHCGHCKGAFCREHGLPHQHSCPEAVVENKTIPQCPLCGEYIEFLGGDLEALIDAHVSSGCTSNILVIPEIDPETGKKKKKKKYNTDCGIRKCKHVADFVSECSYCGEGYCLTHLRGKHDCPGIKAQRDRVRSQWSRGGVSSGTNPAQIRAGLAAQKRAAQLQAAQERASRQQAAQAAAQAAQQRAAQAAAAASPPPTAVSAMAMSGSSGSATSSAVVMDLARMKREAQGDASVPESERVYMYVHLPKALGIEFGVPVFVSSKDSIDSLVDMFEDSAGSLGPDGESPLSVFRTSGACERIASGLPLEFMTGFVDSGAAVCLEHVSESEDVLPLDLQAAHGIMV